MAENFSFFDPVEVAPGVWDREYFAQQFTDYFRRLVTTGVMKGESGELKVSTEGNSMITTLNTGVAYVVGRSYENTSPLSHTHDTEVLGKNRIDRIVVRLDLRTESRFVKSFIKKGVASTSPVPPDLQRDQFIYEISLAQVKVIGGQTYINANDVVDERGKTDICPWAGSKILPNFDNATLEAHIHDYKEHIPYVVATGTGADYLLSIDGVTSLYEGFAVSFKANVDNTDNAPRVKINNIFVYIKKPNGQAPKAGSMKKDGIYTLRYNGKDFILQGEGGSGTALPEDVIVLKTFTNDDGEQKGTMPNNGAQIITPRFQAANTVIPRGYHNGSGYVKNLKYDSKSVYASSALRTSATWARYFSTSFVFGFAPVGCVIYLGGVYVYIGSDTYPGQAVLLVGDLVNGNQYGGLGSVSRHLNGGNSGNPLYSMRQDTYYGSGVRVVGNTIYADVEVSSGIEQPRLETYAGLSVIAWGF
ncbi:hypothetical protein HYI36_13005 [Bacillus sp. Gen3]|nr:hypothetical protein [Bacillus sp. Gen3]